DDRATVIVSCDIELADVEVNAMNLLGLQYTFSCQVLNKEMLNADRRWLKRGPSTASYAKGQPGYDSSTDNVVQHLRHCSGIARRCHIPTAANSSVCRSGGGGVHRFINRVVLEATAIPGHFDRMLEIDSIGDPRSASPCSGPDS